MFKDLKAETDRQCVIFNAIRAIAVSKLDRFIRQVAG